MTTTETIRPADHVAVFGGGGLYGIAYNMGVADALRYSGHPLDSVDVFVGTSAGTWAAAALATGVSFDEIVDTLEPHVSLRPQLRSGGLGRLARLVFADRRSSRVVGVACLVPSLRRVRLHGDRCDLADLIAASSSIPGLVPPHRVARMRLVDGGTRSNTSVDLAPDAAQLTVVSPITATSLGPLGWRADQQLDSELDLWQGRNPSAAVSVHAAGVEHAELVSRPWHLFDVARARDSYQLAFELTAAAAPRPV